MYNNQIINEKQLDYATINKIKEHAKEYDYVADKKEFLRNVSPYEQKVILLNSSRPYEVLNYLSELELKTTKLILSALTYDEITEILQLFTMEDKKAFYKNFSDLDLVNQFINYDKNASDYIADLSIERKIDLLDSSDSDTIVASSKVYETIPEEQRNEVVDKITTVDGINALNNSSSYKEDVAEEVLDDEQNNVNKEDAQEQKVENSKIENEVDKEKAEEQEENLKLNELNEFLKERLQHYKENIPGFENLDINNPEIYESLPPELQAIIDNDFELSNNQNKPELLEETKENTDLNINTGDSQLDGDPIPMDKDIIENEIKPEETLAEFTQAKDNCEKIEIEKIIRTIEKPQLEGNTIQKTL